MHTIDSQVQKGTGQNPLHGHLTSRDRSNLTLEGKAIPVSKDTGMEKQRPATSQVCKWQELR